MQRHRPSKVEIALRYYYASQPAATLEMENAGDIRELLSDGILERAPAGGFLLSARGEKWIEMLIHTPYPEARWIDPREWDRAAEAEPPTVSPVAVESQEREERGQLTQVS
jgi:hypothetical protein